MGEATDSRELLPALTEFSGHLFWRAAARVTDALGDVLPPGVDIHGYAALLALAGGATRSQQAIAEMVSVSRTTMTRVAADLVAQGLVDRVRNVDDRRSYALTRTAAGAAAARRWRRHAEDVEDAVTAGFDLDEREDLRRSLLRLAEPHLATDTPDALRESIPFLISRVHASMHALFLTALEPAGIEPSHFGTLVALDTIGPTPQSGLARTLGVSEPRVVQIADALERNGLVVRRRPASDRRIQALHLTLAAGPALELAQHIVDETSSEMLADLSAADHDRLLDLLRRVITAP